jgi:hypothetical protein
LLGYADFFDGSRWRAGRRDGEVGIEPFAIAGLILLYNGESIEPMRRTR